MEDHFSENTLYPLVVTPATPASTTPKKMKKTTSSLWRRPEEGQEFLRVAYEIRPLNEVADFRLDLSMKPLNIGTVYRREISSI